MGCGLKGSCKFIRASRARKRNRGVWVRLSDQGPSNMWDDSVGRDKHASGVWELVPVLRSRQ